MPQHNYKTSAALNSMMRDQVFSQDYSQLIKELHFTIDSDFVRAFPRLLTRLSNHPFKELKLSFTIPIAPNSALFLISQLLGENIRGLTHLKLNMRHISEIDTLLLGLMEEIQISNSMKRNNSLESVTLEPPVDTNNIQVYTLFIEALQFMAKLKNLTLKIAPAQERGLAMLLRNTTTLTNLRLTLGWPTNTSTSQSITRLFESIEQNKSLKHLHIEKLPRLNANTLLALESIISNNVSLKSLTINEDNFYLTPVIRPECSFPNVTLQTIQLGALCYRNPHLLRYNTHINQQFVHQLRNSSTKRAIDDLMSNKFRLINQPCRVSAQQKEQLKQHFIRNLNRWISLNDSSKKPTPLPSLPHKYTEQDSPSKLISDFLGHRRSPDNQTINVLSRSCCTSGFFSIIQDAEYKPGQEAEQKPSQQPNCAIL